MVDVAEDWFYWGQPGGFGGEEQEYQTAQCSFLLARYSFFSRRLFSLRGECQQKIAGLEFPLTPPVFVLSDHLVPFRCDFIVAIAAIDWPVISRLEGHFCVLATLSTHYGKHLTPRCVATKAIGVGVPCPPGLAAGRTTPRLIGVTSSGEAFLFTSAEGEGSATLRTLEFLVHKTHWMTSFLYILGQSLVTQSLYVEERTGLVT